MKSTICKLAYEIATLTWLPYWRDFGSYRDLSSAMDFSAEADAEAPRPRDRELYYRVEWGKMGQRGKMGHFTFFLNFAKICWNEAIFASDLGKRMPYTPRQIIAPC